MVLEINHEPFRFKMPTFPVQRMDFGYYCDLGDSIPRWKINPAAVVESLRENCRTADLFTWQGGDPRQVGFGYQRVEVDGDRVRWLVDVRSDWVANDLLDVRFPRKTYTWSAVKMLTVIANGFSWEKERGGPYEYMHCTHGEFLKRLGEALLASPTALGLWQEACRLYGSTMHAPEWRDPKMMALADKYLETMLDL